MDFYPEKKNKEPNESDLFGLKRIIIIYEANEIQPK